jgi:hypothetical protein
VIFTLVRHDPRTVTDVAVLVLVMMRFKIMGSRHGFAVAVAAGFSCLVATATPATEPQRQTGSPVWQKPGAPQRAAIVPPPTASLDLIDIADAIAHDSIGNASGAVVCLAGCNGPRGIVVHVAQGPQWHVASIDAPSQAKPHATQSLAPLAAECIAGCDRKRDAFSERAHGAARSASVRLPQRAIDAYHEYGRAPIRARQHLSAGGRTQQAALATGRKTSLGKSRGTTWAIAQRPVRVR